jgi:signal transduction histidine kinase
MNDAPNTESDSSFAAFLDEFAAAFVRVPATEIDSEIEHWLERFVKFFDADRSSLGQFAPNGTFLVTHAWSQPGYGSSLGVREQDLPWLVAKLRRGEMFAFSRPDDIPAEAVNERLFAERTQIKAHVSLPLVLSNQPLGVLAIACVRRPRSWPPAVLQRLRLVGAVFGNALERRRAVQEHLQLASALEHAGRVAAMGQLASSFAHEIKQPLGAALTNAQTALRLLGRPDLDLAEIRASLEDIVSDIRRAGDIVHESRRFLRRQEPSFATIHVTELLDAVVRFVSPEARIQAVEIGIEVAEGVTNIVADRVQIQQVFINLLLNAFDAVSAKPPEKRRVLLTASKGQEGRVALSVRDSGPGVAESLRATLFEPFVTTKPHGLGIGLPIAQTIVTAHGSRLSYSDARDSGAVFTFSLAGEQQEAHGG